MMMTDSIWSLPKIIIYDASREKVFHGQHFHLKQVLNQNLGSEKTVSPSEEGSLSSEEKKQNAWEDTGKGKERPTG